MKTFTELMEDRRQLNLKHKIDPQVGDFWNDHFCPICLVKAVSSTPRNNY